MSTAWLKNLEEKVQEAAQRLRQAREQNTELQARVGELEKALSEAQQSSQEAEAWQTERTDIQKRVGSLVDHLEELLAD